MVKSLYTLHRQRRCNKTKSIVYYRCLVDTMTRLPTIISGYVYSHINNKLDNPHQSAYKPGHPTETALLSIKNEVHLSGTR